MAVDASTIVGSVILAASNLGAAKILLDRSLAKQDRMDEALQRQAVLQAETASNLKATGETLQKVQESVEELYESRNDHRERMVKVETTHERNGCNLPIRKGGQ